VSRQKLFYSCNMPLSLVCSVHVHSKSTVFYCKGAISTFPLVVSFSSEIIAIMANYRMHLLSNTKQMKLFAILLAIVLV
jgi:hypothetical protein